MDAVELQTLANAQGRGYLKYWKAISIMSTVSRMPAICSERPRLRRYIANCLEMEGFKPEGIDAVTDALLAAENLRI